MTHPTPTQLVNRSEHSLHHAETCARCRLLLEALAPDPLPVLGIDLAPLRPEFTAAMQRTAPTEQPERLDIWRIEWDGTAALAIVVTTDPRLSVLAVEAAEPNLDRDTLSPVPEHGLSASLSAADTTVEIERYLLDRRVGRTSDTPRAGSVDQSSWEVDAAHRRLQALIAAAERPGTNDESLAGLLAEAGLDRSRLIGLGLERRAADGYVRGTRQPRQGEAHLLAAALGVTVEDVFAVAPQPPHELMLTIHTQPYRALLDERATETGAPVHLTRRSVAAEVSGARLRSKPGSVADWTHELDVYFER